MNCWEQNKREGLGRIGIGKEAHALLEFPYSLVSQAWEGCYLPYPLIPGWAFLYPTLQGRGQVAALSWNPPPHPSYFAKATRVVGEREWGKKFPTQTRVHSGS